MTIDVKYQVPTVAVHTDIFLTQMRDWFAEHMPGVRAELIRLSSVYTRDDPETWEKIRTNGDAAIVGVGH